MHNNDPCDDWPVFVMNGRLCVLRREESGVSPSFWDNPWFVSSKYKVVDTTFIPYAYWETFYAVPIDADPAIEEARREFFAKIDEKLAIMRSFDAMFGEFE